MLFEELLFFMYICVSLCVWCSWVCSFSWRQDNDTSYPRMGMQKAMICLIRILGTDFVICKTSKCSYLVSHTLILFNITFGKIFYFTTELDYETIPLIISFNIFLKCSFSSVFTSHSISIYNNTTYINNINYI